MITSTYRTAVLKHLISGPATPSGITDDAEITITHVSQALNQLRKPWPVELLVAEDRQKERVYSLTDHGTEVWKTIDAEQLV